MSPRIIVLDVRIPFRKEVDLKSKPDEKEAFHSKILKAQSDPKIGAALAQLLTDHEADGIWLQAYRQNPERPFVHEKPHLARPLGAASHPESSGRPARDSKSGPALSLSNAVAEHTAGKSGQLVITAYFPKRDTPRPEAHLAKSTTDIVSQMEALGLMQEHCRERGYLSVNARGEEYEDLEAVRHNSIAIFIAAAVVIEVITLVVGVILWVLKQPTLNGFSPLSGQLGSGPSSGVRVNITGTNFEGGMAVSFNGHPLAYNLVSEGEIATDMLPAGGPNSLLAMLDPQTGPFNVTTSVGSVTSASNFTLLGAAPTISSFSPVSGLVGTSVDILGTNFNGATEVTFNGISASFSVSPDGASITATVPAGATTGPISVTTPGGTATSDPSVFTVG